MKIKAMEILEGGTPQLFLVFVLIALLPTLADYVPDEHLWGDIYGI